MRVFILAALVLALIVVTTSAKKERLAGSDTVVFARFKNDFSKCSIRTHM